MKTSKYELQEEIDKTIQDLLALKSISINDYNNLVDDLKKQLGEEFFLQYFQILMES